MPSLANFQGAKPFPDTGSHSSPTPTPSDNDSEESLVPLGRIEMTEQPPRK